MVLVGVLAAWDLSWPASHELWQPGTCPGLHPMGPCIQSPIVSHQGSIKPAKSFCSFLRLSALAWGGSCTILGHSPLHLQHLTLGPMWCLAAQPQYRSQRGPEAHEVGPTPPPFLTCPHEQYSHNDDNLPSLELPLLVQPFHCDVTCRETHSAAK